jgi:hypothetical protein
MIVGMDPEKGADAGRFPVAAPKWGVLSRWHREHMPT